jgi:enterochelin esterase-like enzyme
MTRKANRCSLIVMFDGDFYYQPSLIPGDTIIDNLIAAKKIPPIVVAFVDQIDRQKDLACSKDFAAFGNGRARSPLSRTFTLASA